MTIFPPPQLKQKLALAHAQEKYLGRVALWRSCLIICLAISLGLSISLPFWQIKHQNQIQIVGLKMVSPDTIYRSLNFSYPQFIWTVNSLSLTQKIESIPSIAAANADKQMIPPRVIISLQEKTPVAIATSEGKVGFLDHTGQWIKQEFYDNIQPDLALPKLKVINYQSQYQQAWSSIYQLISLHPELEINEIHWNQFGSLLLNTKIGRVFLGSDLSQLKRQFEVMLKLQNLPDHIAYQEIAYIDISSPEFVLVQKY